MILVTGSNTTEQHPQVGAEILKAIQEGAKLIVIDPRKIPLADYATLYLQPKVGTNVAWLNGLAHVIIEENLCDRTFVDERTDGFAELQQVVKKYSPIYVEQLTGIPAGDLVKAARLYAGADKAMIFYCMGLTQFTSGVDNVRACANLAMLTGNIGRPGTGVNPLRGQNNVQGACDMGALPNVLTGYQKVDDEDARSKFEQAWQVKLPAEPGLTLTEMIRAAEEGKIKCLYIMGENPLVSDPDINHVRKAFEKLELLIVQDIFLTETAALADIVLPGACFAEKEGTFTNTERRVQRVRQALAPKGKAMEDWRIILALACKMGYLMGYETPEEIMEEIAVLTPAYRGITYQRLEDEKGLQWPCPDMQHPGTPYLHKDRFSCGRGKFHAVDYRPPAETPNDDYPYILTTGRTAYQFHTGTMTGRTSVIQREVPDGYVEINKKDAQKIGIRDGWPVEVSSARGKVVCRASVSDTVPAGTVFMPFHFAETAANLLTNSAVDPIAKIPEYKVCAVKIKGVD
ncbi:formate dehydrogenase subunit alpha [Thermincola ferriacetica]|uniref:Formate dehydrogenase subunit alpha n=1 Tax=Thermincola ferriacetica TaxID=281456 RepID=A0A0L6W360_9FIRM|nr:formate dehydrogenase subunit alpha [Thermincola ferriacetica]